MAQNSAFMGITDSPLRDHAIFVQGAPRSGTTWLAILMATHPQIAGIQAESHLFEYGVNTLFDSFEGRVPGIKLPLLKPYLTHEELVDLARDLCDGVFLAMRSRVSRGADPPFVVEKTPTSLHERGLDLRRKRECYPDGWYLHIVRDGDAVTRSLMRAPWMADRSPANCHRTWRECVELTREALGDHPRYREVSYEELRADPERVARELFGWVDVDAGDDVLNTVRALSGERFSEQAAVPAVAGSRGGIATLARGAASRMLGLVRRGGRKLFSKHAQPTGSPLGFHFVLALRQGDAEALKAITSDRLLLSYRSPDGDLSARGDEARGALMRIGRQVFDPRHVNARWSAAQGGPREWWTSTPGEPFWTIFFSGLAGDATRLDVAFALTAQDDVVQQVTVFSTGSLSGRPVRQLNSSSEPALFGRDEDAREP